MDKIVPEQSRTMCCHIGVAPDIRFCPKCGWEFRAAPSAPDAQGVPDEPSYLADARETMSESYPWNMVLPYIDALRALLPTADERENEVAELKRRLGEVEDAGRIWHYRTDPKENGDCRKLVTLHENGMRWIGLRAWNFQGRFWMNGGEPESAKVHAWADLPEIAGGSWQSGNFHDLSKDAADLFKYEATRS